jgi:hypothetical protein
MTKEEYRARTKLTSVDEAHSLLNRTRIIFAVEALATVLMQLSRYETSYPTYAIIWFALTIFFVIHCVVVIKKTREVTRAWAPWSVILAPISWIWFYPELVKPLKIVLGTEPVPDVIRPRLTAENRKNINQKFWRNLLIIFVISFVVVSMIAIQQNFG